MNTKQTLFCCALLLAGSAGAQGKLTVRVEGLKTTKGKLYVAIYNKPEGFLDEDKTFKRDVFPVTGTTTSVTFDALPAATYAVTLYHDENGNGKLDRSAVGMPKEGFGFSQNPKIRFRAPDFKESSFRHGSDAQTMTIKLN